MERAIRRLASASRVALMAARDPGTVGKAVTHSLGLLRRGGLRLLTHRAKIAVGDADYQRWLALTEAAAAADIARGVDFTGAGLAVRSRLSVVMPVYDPEPAWLDAAIASVVAQGYPDWELCIADDASREPRVIEMLRAHAAADARIRLLERKENGHICRASNSALGLATGDWVVLLDHDDLLHPRALYWIAAEIAAHPEAELIYSDQDKIGPSGRRYAPYFKPEFNADLLLSHNMIGHAAAYRTTTLRALGGFRPGYEGAQDYDLALRVVDHAGPARVRHIPRVLYHWRAHDGSTSSAMAAKPYAIDAARRAISDHLQRRALAAEVVQHPELHGAHRVIYGVPRPAPLVSAIVLTRAETPHVEMALRGLLEETSYPALEVLVVVNGPSPTPALLPSWVREDRRVQVFHDASPFNFAALNNRHATQARGELLLLLNDDVEVLHSGWLEEMAGHALRPGVGAVGARLWYPDGTLQHGGVVMGLGGVAGHVHLRTPRGAVGRNARAVLAQSFSAVTGACLLVRRRLYAELGGLDERFAVAYNDIDFCLRVTAAGYRNVWTPFAELVHHESATREADTTPEKMTRLAREAALLRERWQEVIASDPCWNPNLSLTSSHGSPCLDPARIRFA